MSFKFGKIFGLISALTLTSVASATNVFESTKNDHLIENKVNKLATNKQIGSSYNPNVVTLTPFEIYLKTELDKKNTKIDVRQFNFKYDNELNSLCKAFHRKLPEYYLMYRPSKIEIDENKDGITDYLEIEYPIDRMDELEEEWVKFYEKAQYCVSDVEKALVANDYIADAVRAGAELESIAHDIEGALLEGMAVCEGYAHTYKYFMNRLGIPCNIVSGQIIKGEPHAWNQVKIDGQWYMIDPLYNDLRHPKTTKHDYFLVTDNYLKLDRVWDFNAYEKCIDTKYENAFWQKVNYEIVPFKGKLYSATYHVTSGPNPSFEQGLFEHTLGVDDISTPGKKIVNCIDVSIEEPWPDENNSVLLNHYSFSVYKDEFYLAKPKKVVKLNLKTLDETVVFELPKGSNDFIWDIKTLNGKLYYDASPVAKGVREYKSFTIDSTFIKRNQCLNTNFDIKELPLSGNQYDFIVQSRGKTSVEAVDKSIIEVTENFNNEGYSIKPLAVGETDIVIKGLANDRYNETSKTFRVKVVKGNTEIYLAGDKATKELGNVIFTGTLYINKIGSGIARPSGNVAVNVYGDNVKLLPNDVTYTLNKDTGFIDYKITVKDTAENYKIKFDYSGDSLFNLNTLEKEYFLHVHLFDQEVVAPEYLKSEATCTSGSVYYKSCKCGTKGSTTFTLNDKKEHLFDEGTCTWSSDYTKADVTFKCLNPNCTFHSLKIAVVTKEITSDSTCNALGTTTYIAKVTFNSKEYVYKKEVQNIPLKEHTYNKGVCTFSSDNKKATVTFTCATCNEAITKEAVVTSKVKIDSTCSTLGTTLYEAKVNFNNQEYAFTKEVKDIPMKPHSLKAIECVWNEDNTKATITFKCVVCNSAITKEATITKVTKVPATCNNKGTTEYSATVVVDGKEYKFTKEAQDIEVTPHHYENGTCTDCGVKDPNYKEPTPDEEHTPQNNSDDNTTIYIVAGSISGIILLGVIAVLIYLKVKHSN